MADFKNQSKIMFNKINYNIIGEMLIFQLRDF
jgi:hypothetical protein